MKGDALSWRYLQHEEGARLSKEAARKQQEEEARLAAEAAARAARMGGDEHQARRLLSDFMETTVAEALAVADNLRADLERSLASS